MTIRVAHAFRENGKNESHWAFQFKPFITTTSGLEFSTVYLIDNGMMLEHCICEDLRKATNTQGLYEDLKFYDCGYTTFKRMMIGTCPENVKVDDYRVNPEQVLYFLIALIIKRTNMQNGTIEWQSEPR